MAARQYGFTEARRRLTELVDRAQHEAPQLIRRRKASEDDVVLISRRLLRGALVQSASERFKVKKSREQDGSITMTLEPFALAVNGPDEAGAVVELLADAQAYAEEFMDKRELYLNSSNRAAHLPLVLTVLACAGPEELREALDLA